MSSTFQELFNENNIYTDSITTGNLIVTGTIDLSGAELTGFPVDDSTIEVKDGVLAFKQFGIKTQQLDNNSVTTVKILNNSITNEKLHYDSVSTSKIIDLNVTNEKIVSIISSKVIGAITNDINNEIIITEDLSVAGNAVITGILDAKDITAQNITAVDTIDAKNITVENITIDNATLPNTITVNNVNITGKLNVTGDLESFPVDDSTINISIDDELQVKNFGITSNKIADDAVTTDKINDYAITTDKLDDNSVTTDKLVDGSITTNKLLNDAVITSKIADSSVTSSKIDSNAVITSKISDSSVTSSKIDSNAVTTIKIDNNAVTTVKIDNNAVTTAKITNDAITTPKLLNGSVTSAKLDTNIIVSGNLNASTLNLSSTTDSTSTNTGSLITAGGVGIAKNINIGGKAKVIASNAGESSPDLFIQAPSNNVIIGFSTSTSGNRVMLTGRGALNIAYKLIEWDAWNGGGGVTDFNNTNFYSQLILVLNYNSTRLYIPLTTDSSSFLTGALITAGGMGIAKNLYVGSLINGAIITSGSSISAATTITSGSSISAATTITSGDTITANLLVGSTTPSGSLVSLTTPSNYPGIIITRGSNKRWDLQNGSAASTDDLFINSKNANNSSSTTKLRLGWGSTDSILRGSLLPDSDNNYQLGNNGNRWSSISAASAFFSNNASVVTTSPASTSLLTIGNTSNTSNSDSNIILRTGGTSSGNPFITHQIVAGSVFSTGIDNADSDKYKISNSIVLGTNDVLSIDTNQNLSLTKDFGTVSGMPFYGLRAYVRFNGSIASTKTGTYVKVSGNTDVIVTMTNHGLVIGNQIFITFNTSSGTLPTNEIYTIISTSSANSFQATGTTNLNVSGNMSLLGGSIDIARNVNFVSYIKVGNYIVNFNSPFIDDSYATTVTSKYNVASNRYDVYAGILANYTGCVHVYTGYGSFSAFNSENVNVTVLR